MANNTGTPVSRRAEMRKRKKRKPKQIGSIQILCPFCRKPVKPPVSQCPYCSYDFRTDIDGYIPQAFFDEARLLAVVRLILIVFLISVSIQSFVMKYENVFPNKSLSDISGASVGDLTTAVSNSKDPLDYIVFIVLLPYVAINNMWDFIKELAEVQELKAKEGAWLKMPAPSGYVDLSPPSAADFRLEPHIALC